MRGLKPFNLNKEYLHEKSHLLQMRGLKQKNNNNSTQSSESHLLQMRGLKPPADVAGPIMGSRIFYRCVD